MDDLVHQMRPLWIHCGIPCGTASRARQLPISSRLKALGVPTPRPLRSAKFPLGLPDLTALEAAKVESANAVYRTCVRVLFAAYKVNSIVSIENPARAWTWAALAALVVQFGRDNGCPDFVDWYFNLHDVFFSMCMHGGQRKKDTRLKSSPQIFSSLAAQCDGSHSHEPYGQKREGGSWKFDTAAEAQYPRVLCLRMVKAASQAVAPAMFADTSRRFRLDSLAALGEQTVKHPPLIPEYRQVVWSPTVPSRECKLLPDYSEEQCDVAIDHAEVPSWPVPLLSTDLPTRVPLDSSATEKLAWTLLQQKRASKDDILQLVSLLPRPHHSRRQAQAPGLSWIAGAYVFSSEVGLHSSTRTLPFTTCLLAQVLLHFARGIVFSSLAVFADFAGPEHRDAHNDHRFYNAIVPLSEFQQGGVQVADQILPVASGPCFLQSGLLHRVLPAVGQRVVLVGFTVRSWASLLAADVDLLRSLRFSWPADSLRPSNLAGEGSVGGRIYPDGVREHRAWGVYHSMEEHVEAATGLEHPADSLGSIPDSLRRAIFDIATLGPQEMAEVRLKAISEIEEKAKEFGLNEGDPITNNKCLRLFRELVEETEFEDPAVCDFMEKGVSLVGGEPPSDLFPKRPKPMRASPEQLDSQAVWRRRELLSKPPQKLSEDELAILNDETEAEVKMGFLEGPFHTEHEVSERLGSEEWSPSQRFLLLQGEDKKPRVIDNLRDSGVNAAFGSTSLLQLHDIDFVMSLAMFISRVWKDQQKVRVQLRDGTVLEGPWNAESRDAPWVGRCLDLSKAYKQVPVNVTSLKYAVIAVPSRSSQWTFYIARGLPFGGSGSVYAFNKISRAIWHIAVTKLKLVTSVYVDDYPTFELLPLAANASNVFSRLLTALGWVHATEGKKAVDFSSRWAALGAAFDFSKLHHGELTVSNKEGRLERIVKMAQKLPEGDCDVKQVATSLHGLLNFASGFVLGSALKPISRAYSRLAARPSSFGSHDILRVTELLKIVISNTKPRVFKVSDPARPLLIYTDGSYEDSVALWGAFVCDLQTGEKRVLSGKVPESIRRHWTIVVGKQIICEIELFAFLCAKWYYGRRMNARKGFVFIDNSSALATLVKRNSQSEAMFRLVAAINSMDAVFPFGAWYERVPSKSNPSDLPSRGEAGLLCQKFGAENDGDFEVPDVITRFVTLEEFSPAVLDESMRLYFEHHRGAGDKR